MSTNTAKHKTPWRYRRFWRLFRREKPACIDVTYSYQYMMRFPRLPITIPPLVPTLMSYRWNDDDENEAFQKKLSRDNPSQQYIRRRFPKRYSDIVGPSSNKIYLPHNDGVVREKQTNPHQSAHNHHRSPLKMKSNEALYIVNSPRKKSSDLYQHAAKPEKKERSIIARRYSSKIKHSPTANAVDLLAHRMQAAMSSELMYSLDRNFVFGDKKQALSNTHVNRSQSFHSSTSPANNWWERSPRKEHFYHIISKSKHSVDDERRSTATVSSVEELTPDYDEDEIIIRESLNDNSKSHGELNEEPTIDYDDSKSTITVDNEEKPVISPTLYDLGITTSFIVQQTSLTPNSDTFTKERSPGPPTPPPFPIMTTEPKKTIFRCRTIADRITFDHKLILKDERDIPTEITEEKSTEFLVLKSEEKCSKKHFPNAATSSQPCYLHLSQELLDKTNLRKVSHPVSRSYSSYGSMSRLNDYNTQSMTFIDKTSITNEQLLDGLSSSATTSIVIENEYDHRASAKIYNDYKRRTSVVTSVPTNTALASSYSHAAIIHPMHTHIGLRSSTSSSSNDKLNDNTTSNKKMNFCVINQLNEHLLTRFRGQENIYVTKRTNVKDTTIPEVPIDDECYDPPPEQARTECQLNFYDEPHHLEVANTTSKQCMNTPASSIPPPPPPLPIGGFRTVTTNLNRPPSSQRTSSTTLPRDLNSADLRCSTGTSTTSSKLSDARILRELRTNPLFAKAKEHLEIEPILNNSHQSNESQDCYLRLDTCSKGTASTIQNESQDANFETFVMKSEEVRTTTTGTTAKRTKSLNSTTKTINQINSRIFTKPFLQTQCRQSELEVIFQKRAQRSEQNLT